MNVTRKNIDDLNAILTVEIKEDDYKENVEKALANYRKNAVIPGFRKGKVPAGLIRKQYYKPLAIDEVNKIIQDAVYNYLNDEKLDVLGNPLPIEQRDIDWDNQKDFEFEFELGLTPNIDVTLPKNTKLSYMKVVADDKMVNDYVEDVAKRYGKLSTPEKAEKEDLFNGDFVELDAEGNPVEGGITKNASFAATSLSQEETINSLLNLEVGQQVTLDPHKDFSADFNLARLLGTTDDKLEQSQSFGFTLKSISRLEPHALDQELFDKVLGEGKASTEEEFKNELKAQLESQFIGQSDSDFFHHAYHYYLDNVKFDLPEEFLKKWLRTAGDKPLSAEEVEEQFPQTIKALRWQLIENRIIKANDISVNEEELRNYAKQLITAQMMQYGQMMPDEELDKIAENVLKNREEAQRMNDQIYNQKLVAYFKDAFKLDTKEVTVDEFYKHQAEHQH